MAFTQTPTTRFAKNATTDAQNVLLLISIILFAFYVEETEKMTLNAIAMADFTRKQFQVSIVAHVMDRVSPATDRQLGIVRPVKLLQRSNY
jgi:hypothetical protein